MSPPIEDVTGVILVGGKSRRMGADKALLRVDGRTLTEIVVEAVRLVVPRVILVGGPAERFADLGLPVHPDVYPGSALGGLYTGLLAAGTRHIFAVACDMPFPDVALIRHLLSLREGHDVVVPRRGGLVEPLFAVYSRRCQGPMKSLLEAGNYRIYDFFADVRTLYVDEGDLERLHVDGASFANVNTPEEYRRIVSKRPPPRQRPGS